MSSKLAIMAGLAVVFGATSYYAGNQYLETQAQRIGSAGPASAMELGQVVVAAQAMKFGETITEEMLKLVDWPKNAMPEGAFTSIEEVVAGGERKAIKSIEPNEPVLAVKVTGENARAGLAGIISEGMRAVTIPVDQVKGVGGFVQPGDRVDIVFAQRDRQTGEQVARIILENVKVLSIDQQAESRSDAPKIAQSVTLETDAHGAQKLALATNVGKLSLLLRGAGDDDRLGDHVVSFSDSGQDPGEEGELPPRNSEEGGFLSFLNGNQDKTRFATVRVVRGDEVIENSVPVLSSMETASGESR